MEIMELVMKIAFLFPRYSKENRRISNEKFSIIAMARVLG